MAPKARQMSMAISGVEPLPGPPVWLVGGVVISGVAVSPSIDSIGVGVASTGVAVSPSIDSIGVGVTLSPAW